MLGDANIRQNRSKTKCRETFRPIFQKFTVSDHTCGISALPEWRIQSFFNAIRISSSTGAAGDSRRTPRRTFSAGYYNDYYGYGGLGNYGYYGGYYGGYGGNYDSGETTTTTKVYTDIPSFSPLIFQIYIEPDGK